MRQGNSLYSSIPEQLEDVHLTLVMICSLHSAAVQDDIIVNDNTIMNCLRLNAMVIGPFLMLTY